MSFRKPIYRVVSKSGKKSTINQVGEFVSYSEGSLWINLDPSKKIRLSEIFVLKNKGSKNKSTQWQRATSFVIGWFIDEFEI